MWTVEYLDIVNYEIAREKYMRFISSYYPDYPKMPNPPKKCRWKAKIQDLIYYRDNLQIEDKDNIQKVFKYAHSRVSSRTKTTKQLRKN